MFSSKGVAFFATWGSMLVFSNCVARHSASGLLHGAANRQTVLELPCQSLAETPPKQQEEFLQNYVKETREAVAQSRPSLTFFHPTNAPLARDYPATYLCEILRQTKNRGARYGFAASGIRVRDDPFRRTPESRFLILIQQAEIPGPTPSQPQVLQSLRSVLDIRTVHIQNLSVFQGLNDEANLNSLAKILEAYSTHYGLLSLTTQLSDWNTQHSLALPQDASIALAISVYEVLIQYKNSRKNESSRLPAHLIRQCELISCEHQVMKVIMQAWKESQSISELSRDPSGEWFLEALKSMTISSDPKKHTTVTELANEMLLNFVQFPTLRQQIAALHSAVTSLQTF